MFVNYFIKRPIFATVCALIFLLVGAVSIPTLPIAQYPDISPTQVNVSARYVGADAETVERGVTTVIERQINGVEGMRYITSNSSNDGASNIVVTTKTWPPSMCKTECLSLSRSSPTRFVKQV
jgi:hydrophobic/amphiphilic exporter-1 (mainly G- bacteria), HAE1 family